MATSSGYLAAVYATRSAVIVVFLVVAYRLVGKRSLGQFHLYDLVTLITVANAVQNSLTGGRGELVIGLASSTTVVVVAWGAAHVVRFRRLERPLTGHPVVLVHHGVVFGQRLRHEHVTRNELDAAIRSHGLTDPDEVELAVLEPDGTISVVPVTA